MLKWLISIWLLILTIDNCMSLKSTLTSLYRKKRSSNTLAITNLKSLITNLHKVGTIFATAMADRTMAFQVSLFLI